MIQSSHFKDDKLFNIILYIASSQDGFIADKNGEVDWLPQPKEEDDIFGYKNLLSRIDIILMGSTSYQQIKSFGGLGVA